MNQKKIPLRKCMGCREMKDKQELLRVVKIFDGTFKIDQTKKQAGRGAYVCYNQVCLNIMHKKKGLERSFKTKIPQEIYNDLQILISGGG